MAECTKTYTINRKTGERLTCSGNHLKGNFFRDNGLVHECEWNGKSFIWYDSESDKEKTDD